MFDSRLPFVRDGLTYYIGDSDVAKGKGPKFVQFFDPLIRALHELGGSGSASEVIEVVARLKGVSEAEQQERLASGGLRFNNQVHFARQYLLWAGLLESSQRGVWNLSDKGRAVKALTHEEALAIFKREHVLHANVNRPAPSPSKDEAESNDDAEEPKYKENVLAILKHLTPRGFEHFCKRLLREHGFERVEVTGGPKDKGIDGNGVLKVNPFVSFRVVFQCKRYDEAVTSSEISKFRGSIPSSVDKGILITTGYFTTDATRLAQEPSLKPIELVDGDELVKLMEKLELGLKRTFDVDDLFFDEFREKSRTNGVPTISTRTSILATS